VFGRSHDAVFHCNDDGRIGCEIYPNVTVCGFYLPISIEAVSEKIGSGF
jgi:hypothetical protein